VENKESKLCHTSLVQSADRNEWFSSSVMFAAHVGGVSTTTGLMKLTSSVGAKIE
jgi:hypothetical protein